MHVCRVCQKSFSLKSSLTRHVKLHASKENACDVCGKLFATKPQLLLHRKQHQYPVIRLYGQGEALLQSTPAAKTTVPLRVEDATWLDPGRAEAAARVAGGKLWRGQIVLTFGKYAGQTYKWLLENDVGWTVRLLSEYCQKGEADELLKWQKECLLHYVNGFPYITCHLDKRLKKRESGASGSQDSQQGESYASDAELLAAAETILDESEGPVATQLATPGELTADDIHSLPGPSSHPGSSSSASVVLEGWQKFWEHPPSSGQTTGIAAANIKWLMANEEYGLFERASRSKNAQGEIVTRKLLKRRMEFVPPPLPTEVRGALPDMLSFFTTPAFFWRPVGVMEAVIRCPNTNCPAPPGEYLEREGYGSLVRQVCGAKVNYTLLTEKLKCKHCEKIRKASASTSHDDDSEEEEGARSQQSYIWLACSPKILMNLSPAVRSIFPAVLCGKRAVDKAVVSMLSDRLDAHSMSKVQQLLQQSHDEWYLERRDLYQTLLFEAHTSGSQQQTGIPSYLKPAGTYTPPIPRTPLPSARVLRRAHLIMEMEKMPVYRNQILSVTGEILCIYGSRQVLKKIYGDGRGTMQYLTIVLNEWGQFVTTMVVTSESEGCYARMARGLMARFERANAPAPKVLYADNCCRASGSPFFETLFSDWVQRGTVVRLDVRHWLHRWGAVVVKQSHAKYGAFMSAMAGAVLAYNKGDMMLLAQAVRNGAPELYAKCSDQEMIALLKPHQIRSHVRRMTRGVEETAAAVSAVIARFKGPAGLDVDGIHLFKSAEAVDSHWATASRHFGCMQDPPGVQLYVAVKTVVLNGVQLHKYRCRRGSNSLEGLPAHLNNAFPSQRCGIMPFQVYLISFAVQWNNRMESLRVAGGQGQQTTCTDPRQIQRMNRQAEVLFGKEHVLEPNFSAPMPDPDEYGAADEEELLGVEYAVCQSTAFSAKPFYARKAEEEQSREEEEDETESGEDGSPSEGVDLAEEDPIDGVCQTHGILLKTEQGEEEESSPALQDVLMRRHHLHLPAEEERSREEEDETESNEEWPDEGVDLAEEDPIDGVSQTSGILLKMLEYKHEEECEEELEYKYELEYELEYEEEYEYELEYKYKYEEEEESSPALQDVLMRSHHLHLPAEEEQSCKEEDETESEESPGEGVDLAEEDPINDISQTYGILLKTQDQEEEESSPALQDVLMRRRHLHLPGIEEVEALAVLLVQLADSGDSYPVPVDLRQRIVAAAGRLHDRDRSVVFGRCLGADTPESSAAQVTEDSRLLYLLVKMLQNRAPSNKFTSPTEVTASIRGQYQRIAGRVRDDPILGGLQIPLPHLDTKSISSFLREEEKRANFMATVRPVSKTEEPLPDTAALQMSLPAPDRPQVQHQDTHHVAGRSERKRLRSDEPAPEWASKRRAAPETDTPTEAAGRPATATHLPQMVSAAPILLVVPAQPTGSSQEAMQ